MQQKAKIVSFPARLTTNDMTDLLREHGYEVLHMSRTHVPAYCTDTPDPYGLVRSEKDYQFLPLGKDVTVLKEFRVVDWEISPTFYPGDVLRLWRAGNLSSPAIWTVKRAI